MSRSNTTFSIRQNILPMVGKDRHSGWKTQLLSFLTRLKDTDTQGSAVRGIHDLMDHVDMETFPMFLSALKKGWSDRVQRPSTRREYIRLVAAASRLSPSLCGHFLPRTIGVVMGWSSDKDNGVREACADCMGDLAEYATTFYMTQHSSGGLGVFFRPILDGCKPREANFHRKAGALLCLARVAFRVDGDLLANELHRLLPRIVDMYLGEWVGQSAQSRGILHDACSNIIKRMCLASDNPFHSPLAHHIRDLTGFFLDDLHSAKEWKTRERAAATMGVLGLHYYQAAKEAGGSDAKIVEECTPIVDALVFARSDRIPNVRDAVSAALEVYGDLGVAQPERTPRRSSIPRETFSAGACKGSRRSSRGKHTGGQDRRPPSPVPPTSSPRRAFDHYSDANGSSGNVLAQIKLLVQSQEQLQLQMENFRLEVVSRLADVESRIGTVEQRLYE